MPRPNTVPELHVSTTEQSARAGEQSAPAAAPATNDAATNRHPVDQLADVRAEIKTLKTREEQLRDKSPRENATRSAISTSPASTRARSEQSMSTC